MNAVENAHAQLRDALAQITEPLTEQDQERFIKEAATALVAQLLGVEIAFVGEAEAA